MAVLRVLRVHRGVRAAGSPAEICSSRLRLLSHEPGKPFFLVSCFPRGVCGRLMEREKSEPWPHRNCVIPPPKREGFTSLGH